MFQFLLTLNYAFLICLVHQSAALDETGCGTTRGCFSKDSSYIVSWTVDNTDVIYTLASSIPYSSGSWMAVGFSSDTSMGDDGVNGCAFGSDGKMVTWSGVNRHDIEPAQFNDTSVTLVNSSITDNTQTCTFRRPIAASSDGKRRDVSKQWYLLFAKGQASVTNGVVTVTDHQNNKWVSSSKYSSNSMVGSGAQDQYNVCICLHICTFILAMIGLCKSI